MKVLRNNPLLGVALALVVLIGAALLFWPNGDRRTLVADFPRTVSVYEGSDVKMLGVPIGQIDQVTPDGTKVRVKMHYDGKYKVPAAAKAVIVSPAVVGDRYIQLTPAYTGGPTLPDNAKLGLDRTAAPLELDEIFGSLNDLSKALGPQGANSDGALTHLIDSTARNFGGQGVQFNQTIRNLGQLTETLANNKDELFGSAAELEKFIGTLARSDQTVRQFNDALASGANLLAGEREDLAAALNNLAVALTDVRGFVKDNRALLTSNISGLNKISKTVVKNRAALNETLRNGPLAWNDLGLAYNRQSGTLDTRMNIAPTLNTDPRQLVCSLLGELAGQQGGDLGSALAGACSGSANRAAPALGPGDGKGASYVHEVQQVDRSLGGLVEVKR